MTIVQAGSLAEDPAFKFCPGSKSAVIIYPQAGLTFKQTQSPEKETLLGLAFWVNCIYEP